MISQLSFEKFIDAVTMQEWVKGFHKKYLWVKKKGILIYRGC